MATREKELTPSEAAPRLKIGMQRLYDLLHSGKLRATKRSGRWIIPESAIIERQQHVEALARLQGLTYRSHPLERIVNQDTALVPASA